MKIDWIQILRRALHAGRDTVLPAFRRFYLRLPHRRAVLAGIAGITVLAMAMLVLRTPDQAAPAAVARTPVQLETALPDEPVVLAFTPVEAPPGAPVYLSGVPLVPGTPFEVLIEGELVPAQRLADGRIQMHVPVEFGSGDWPVAARGEQALEVRVGSRSVAKSSEGLRIIDLPRAPGTTARVQQSLQIIVSGYERILESLPAQDETEMAHRRAVIAMLKGLVSDGDRSLAAVLAGNSPWLAGASVDLELTDALLASSGVAGHLEAKARVFMPSPGAAAFPTAMAMPSMLSGPQCRSGGKAFELACQMQAHGLIWDLSQAFIKPMADTYADFLGLGLGALGLHPDAAAAMGKSMKHALAVHQIISALLSMVNFTMEKIAPSLLPSRLQRFDLEIDPTLIRSGDMTQSRLVVEASNQPQTITVNDMVDLVKSILGLPKLSKPFEDAVTQVGFYVIDLYMGALRRFGINPPAAANPGLFTMPLRRWGPVEVESADLVTLYSFDESILASRENELEWEGVDNGIATVRMMVRSGERAKVLEDNTLCWGCVWSGGAFGEEMAESSRKVAVDIDFRAEPAKGLAPHRVKLTWKVFRGDQGGEPRPCTLDFGDGSPVEHIEDCTRTSSSRHTYEYTSRLEPETGGAFVARLTLDKNGGEASAEVFTDWTFRASPASGEAPLETRFDWDIPWPADRKAPSCEFDPGDGSTRKAFDDCLATTRTEHRYERRGSFVPTLTVISDSASDTKTAPVSVAEEHTCKGLLEHKAWTGSVSYVQSRNVANKHHTSHVQYRRTALVEGTLPERDRKQYRGQDFVVSYYKPLDGIASVNHTAHGYHWVNNRFVYRGYKRFMGGSLVPQTPDMANEGSFLVLILKSDCSYSFDFQGDVAGHKTTLQVHPDGATTSYKPGRDWASRIHGEGVVTSSGVISGSGAFDALSSEEIENPRRPPGNFVSETDDVVRIHRDIGKPRGTALVHWHFAPVE